MPPRRYKYLQKPLEESALPTLLQYIHRWTPAQKDKLALTTGLLIGQGLASASCLQSLTKDHLLKNGAFAALNRVRLSPSRVPLRASLLHRTPLVLAPSLSAFLFTLCTLLSLCGVLLAVHLLLSCTLFVYLNRFSAPLACLLH